MFRMMMWRCTVVVDWLAWCFIDITGVRKMVLASQVRGFIGVEKLGWWPITLTGVGRSRVRVKGRGAVGVRWVGLAVCVSGVGGWWREDRMDWWW